MDILNQKFTSALYGPPRLFPQIQRTYSIPMTLTVIQFVAGGLASGLILRKLKLHQFQELRKAQAGFNGTFPQFCTVFPILLLAHVRRLPQIFAQTCTSLHKLAHSCTVNETANTHLMMS